MFQQNRIGSTPPVVLNLIIINALMLLLTWFLGNMNIDIIDTFGLHSFYSSSFRIWQPLTNIFLHGDITHLFFNMFSLWMFGRILEQVWGGKKFLLYYLMTGIGASLLNSVVTIAETEWMRSSAEQVIANMTPDTFFDFVKSYAPGAKGEISGFLDGWYNHPKDTTYINEAKRAVYAIMETRENGITIGASGSVYGVLLAFGMLFPNMMLLLLIPPIPIKAKYMVMIFAGIEIYFGFSGKQPGIAHFAHLGGMLVGYFIIRYWKKHNLMY